MDGEWFNCSNVNFFIGSRYFQKRCLPAGLSFRLRRFTFSLRHTIHMLFHRVFLTFFSARIITL
ncbi:uncharacterized protein Dvar_08030 [Desulfosarcina variabilis str. Montpellier]